MWIPECNSEGIRNFAHPPPLATQIPNPNSWFKLGHASLPHVEATETRQMFW